MGQLRNLRAPPDLTLAPFEVRVISVAPGIDKAARRPSVPLLRHLAHAIWLARGVYHLLPDLSAFDVKTEVVHGLPVATGYLLTTIAYGATYVAALLLAAVVIFSRRDFK